MITLSLVPDHGSSHHAAALLDGDQRAEFDQRIAVSLAELGLASVIRTDGSRCWLDRTAVFSGAWSSEQLSAILIADPLIARAITTGSIRVAGCP